MRFFASGFFHESVSSRPLSILLGPFRFFSKIHGDIGTSRLTTCINDTSGKFATGVNHTATGINDIGGKFCHQFHWFFWYRWQICHRCRWHRWKTMRLISGCRYLKVNLKAKFYIYVKFLWLKFFFICHRCQRQGGQPWAANISATFRKNFKRS